MGHTVRRVLRSIITTPAIVLLSCGDPGDGDEAPRLYPVIESQRLAFVDRSGEVVVRTPYVIESAVQFWAHIAQAWDVDVQDFEVRIGRAGARGGDAAGVLSIVEEARSRGSGGQGTSESDLMLRSLRFHDGRLPYEVDDRWGFLAEDGTVAVSPQYEAVGRFWEGLAKVKRAGRWGFIEPSGILAIPEQFDSVRSFSEGRAAVWIGDRCGYVDRKGKLVVATTLSSCGTFRSGITYVADAAGYWAIGRDGAVRVPPQRYELIQFDGTHFSTYFEGMMGLLDDSGVEVVAPDYQLLLTRDRPGGLWMAVKDRRYGFLSSDGEVVIPLTFDEARVFSRDDVAAVRVGNRWGFIDRKGKFVGGPPAYDEVRDMAEGRAGVRVGDRWGIIDRAGKTIVPPTYKDIGLFLGGLVLVEFDGRGSYVDRDGKTIVQDVASRAEREREFSSARTNYAWMKSDLRNLMTAQETYWTDHSVYADRLALERSGLWSPSPGVLVESLIASGSEFSAVLTKGSSRCRMTYRAYPSSADMPTNGVPICE